MYRFVWLLEIVVEGAGSQSDGRGFASHKTWDMMGIYLYVMTHWGWLSTYDGPQVIVLAGPRGPQDRLWVSQVEIQGIDCGKTIYM